MVQTPAQDWIKVQELKAVRLSQWSGVVTFPNHQHPRPILIYQYQGAYRAIARYCPHQDYDLSGTEVLEGGVVRCQWHGLSISILDDKSSYAVQKIAEDFYCLASHDRV